jgi:hypothetical protein
MEYGEPIRGPNRAESGMNWRAGGIELCVSASHNFVGANEIPRKRLQKLILHKKL